MNTKTVDLINIGLMIISCIAAYLLPFELFLFSYAVLGPLHYLSEISWLHRRDYFVNGKWDYLIFIPLTLLLTYFVVFGEGVQADRWATNLIFTSFAAALAMVFIQKWSNKLLFILIAFVCGWLLSFFTGFQLIFGMYIPTLVHVFLFTGLFIIYGALKSKSVTGGLSVLIFVLCGISFFFYTPVMSWYQVSPYAVSNISNLKFGGLIYSTVQTLHLKIPAGSNAYQVVFNSVAGQSVMRFIAFAYTYHYLNWFSKTSIIKWHKVPRKWLVAVLVAWVSAVALYAIDFVLGLEMLFLLSMLHVFFEFPLNFRSFIGIAAEMGISINTPVAEPAPAREPRLSKKAAKR
jgi:hypothetical protein